MMIKPDYSTIHFLTFQRLKHMSDGKKTTLGKVLLHKGYMRALGHL